MRTCTSFTGAGGTCRAGVAVEDLRDADLRLPCVEINERTGERPCAQRTWPPPPPSVPVGRMAQMLDAIVEGRCPTCQEPLLGEIQVGTKTLAKPCRHVIRSEELR